MEVADSSTELTFKASHRSKKLRNIVLALAVVLCLILLVACIVLAVLYSRELNKSSTTSTSQNVEKYERCDDEQCFYLGLELVRNMNKSVDPCEDFHAYACGGWQRRHPLKNNETRRTTMSVMMDQNIMVLKKALEQAHFNYSKNDAVMKTVRVYNSCLNTAAIDALGLQPLKDLIKEYGGWTISQNYDPNVTVAQRIGRAERELNVQSLFGMYVRSHPLNSDVNVLMLLESGLGLNKKDYLEPDEDSEKKRKEYKAYMKTVSQMFNVSYAKMEAIYDFEVKLAKISSGKSPDDALLDYISKIATQKRNRRITGDGTIPIASLCQATGFSLTVMKEVLNTLFNRKFFGTERILAFPKDGPFLKRIGSLYGKTNHSLIADYIMWQVVRQYVAALPDQYRQKRDILVSVKLPRWKQCIYAMLRPFDMPLGLLYVDAHFNDDTKVKITEMIENVRTSFIQKLPTQTWMDKKTQEMAKQKALAIAIEEIGYPAYIKDPAKLKAQYDSLNVTDSVMDNLKAANHYYIMRVTLSKFQRPVDKKEWTFRSPAEYNAFYSPWLNRIIFLAGILQKPNYSPDYPRYIDYGGIGMIIGHEITHGFDGRGRLFDKNGNFRIWWSAISSLQFESKSKCFIKQYSKFKIFDKYANGNMTLNENIADNGGIKLAYDAYQRWTKENGTEKILPGLDLNPNQLFFLGFAQSWCSVYSKDGAYNQLDNDSHSTAKYRILGTLSNFKKFSEVFKCSANSGMNPVDKCEIW